MPSDHPLHLEDNGKCAEQAERVRMLDARRRVGVSGCEAFSQARIAHLGGMRQIFDSCPELKGDSLQARDTQRRLEAESCGDCRIACFPIGRHVQDRISRGQQRSLGPVVFGIQIIHSQPAVEREMPALLERKVDAGADDPAVIPGFQVFFQGQVVNLGVTVGLVCERL